MGGTGLVGWLDWLHSQAITAIDGCAKQCHSIHRPRPRLRLDPMQTPLTSPITVTGVDAMLAMARTVLISLQGDH
jgi:hypothetical protein